MKVFGGEPILSVNGRAAQVRAIIAATSKKNAFAAYEGTGYPTSFYEFSNYWSETGNELELETALAKPGVLFFAPLDGRDKGYAEYPLKAKEPAKESPQAYKVRRDRSEEGKRQAGEERISSWIGKEAADKLDSLISPGTARSDARSVVSEALIAYAVVLGVMEKPAEGEAGPRVPLKD